MIDVQFGDDLDSYLNNIHTEAYRWMICMRMMGLFSVMQWSGFTQDSPAWKQFADKVAGTWAFPDLTPGEGDKAVFVDRCKQLMKKLPSHEDGEHATWLDPAKKKPQRAAADVQEFNTMNACLRRHHGEVKVMDIKKPRIQQTHGCNHRSKAYVP